MLCRARQVELSSSTDNCASSDGHANSEFETVNLCMIFPANSDKPLTVALSKRQVLEFVSAVIVLQDFGGLCFVGSCISHSGKRKCSELCKSWGRLRSARI